MSYNLCEIRLNAELRNFERCRGMIARGGSREQRVAKNLRWAKYFKRVAKNLGGGGAADVFWSGRGKKCGGSGGSISTTLLTHIRHPTNTKRKMTSQQSKILHSLVFILSVPSAVLNLSEGTVSETSINVSWSMNPPSLQDKFQVSTSWIYLISVQKRFFYDRVGIMI